MILENFFYLGALSFSIAGLLVLDRRFGLAFWHDSKRTALTLAISMAIFVVWDAIGIGTGIFFKGDSHYMLPFTLAPEFPLEELFFLFLLCFVTLILYRGYGLWRRT